MNPHNLHFVNENNLNSDFPDILQNLDFVDEVDLIPIFRVIILNLLFVNENDLDSDFSLTKSIVIPIIINPNKPQNVDFVNEIVLIPIIPQSLISLTT